MIARPAASPLRAALPALVALTASLAVSAGNGACSTPENSEPPPGRGLQSPAASAPRAAAEGDNAQRSRLGAGGLTTPRSRLGEEDGGVAPAAPQRDLAAELRRAIGLPSACLAGANAAGTIRVGITATVQPAGDISRVSVLGGGLTDEGRRCMEARVMGVRLAGPIGIRPTTVTTTVEATQTAAGRPRTETPVTPPSRPLSRDAVPITMAPGRAIDARQGMPIQRREGVPIQRREGQAIDARQGVSIMGPSGVAISN